MRFFNLDLHVSVIADIRDIFQHLGHEVTSWSLSGHAWVFGRQCDRVEVVNEQTWFNLNETMCDQFSDTYRAFLGQFDGFIVTHTPAFYLLYRKLGKPVIVVASTRYEYPFSFDQHRWQWFNAELCTGIDEGQVIAVANNRYDAAYAEYFTGRPWRVIPSYCGYTGARYTGQRKEFIYHSKYAAFPHSPVMVRKEQALPQRYQWHELFDYRGIVHVPYNASTMSIFEQYTAGVPLFFPTPGYLMALYRDNWHSGVLSEISYNQVHQAEPGSAIGGALPGFADPNDYLDLANISRWIALADYYDTTMMPGINYFDSARHLEDMLVDPAIDDCSRVMQVANERRRHEIYASWNEILADIFPLPKGRGSVSYALPQSHVQVFSDSATEANGMKTRVNRPFPIWVLNLERSRDRREYMEKQLKELHWKFEIIPAVDGQCLSSDELKGYSVQQAIETIGREMTSGEIGCALSHAKMWERIVAENIEEVLIFEDDVTINSELMDILDRRHTFPDDWEFINFRTDIQKAPFGPPVYREYRVCHFQSYANRTCAYFINIKGAKKLCEHVYPLRMAADGLTGRTYISDLVSYGMYPDLVELAHFPSVRSDEVLGDSTGDIGGEAKMPIEQSTAAIGTQPLVSAIVSAYNSERFIRGCLEDLEAQTMADRLEIIVVDTGSPQNEGAIVREFQQRYHNIVYIRTAQRESLYVAWNRGIQAARGTYITNANTDDRHKRDAFERMVTTFETRPDIALVYADAYVTTTENETFANHTPVGALNWPDFDPLELLYRCYMGPQPMWRKRMHTTYGYFDESFEVAGDWEFWLRLAENETFLHLREVLGLYLSSPAGIENRNHVLLGQENLRVYQRYVHRADQRTKTGAVSDAVVAKPVNIRAGQPTNAGIVAGTTVTEPMTIKAYKLYDHAAVMQPAHAERDGDAAPGAAGERRVRRAASGTGWVLLCPHAFEATWNGGPNPEDIDIRLDAMDDDAPAFVQSNLGGGLLTLYSGYQLQTTEPDSLWVRGPINQPKDGLYPLEQIVNTLLPATITITWTFTRPNQTVRFAAGEPFCAIMPYPSQYAEQFACEVVEFDDEGALAEHALQQLAQAPEVQAVFQRLQVAAAPAEPQFTASAPEETAARWAVQRSDPSPVSCICLTYGRPELLEEAIYSFLQQDYPGPKELIVLNDYDQQLLEFEHPEVRVINLPRRVRTVGEKRNMAVALASHDLLFVWDDDDICLPHRLSLSVERFEPAKGYFKASSAWLWNNGQLSGPCFNAFHGISCWSRKLFAAVRGYGAAGSGEDRVFEQLLERQFPGSTSASDIRPADIYYIYRWGGTGSYHLSGFGDYQTGGNVGHAQVESYVRQRANRGEIRQGEIPLQPCWKTDYRQLVARYITTLAEQQAQGQA